MTKYTKQTYDLVAEQLRELQEALIADGHWKAGGVSTLAKTGWEAMQQKFMVVFEADNKRFDRSKFIKASTPKDSSDGQRRSKGGRSGRSQKATA